MIDTEALKPSQLRLHCELSGALHGMTMRRSPRFMCNGDVLWHSSTRACKLNVSTGQQTFFADSFGPVTCMALAPQRRWVAWLQTQSCACAVDIAHWLFASNP